MINIQDKSKCCGCTACASKCPKNAIDMIEDEYGFKYPVVDMSKCVHCGLCEKVCPYNNEYTDKKTLKTSIAYGGWNQDEEIRSRSTSGGFFTSIAKYIIEKNGVVCGAIYDDELNVVHHIVDNMEELKKINGSKYVQSDMKDNFKKIKSFLEAGRFVLFSGTPCQVSGLNSFLGKEYENLYVCDIICHGVPSPKVFDKYKEELENQKQSKLTKINFRDKISGWQQYSFSAEFKNKDKYINKASENPYMRAFLADIDLRESCPTCKFAKLPRYADLTLGDFWGVNDNYPELNKDNKGTSLVLVHTEKGKKLLEEINGIFIKKCDLQKAIKGNPSILQHNLPHKNRQKFLEDIEKEKIERVVKKYIRKSGIIKKSIRRFKRNIKKIIKI